MLEIAKIKSMATESNHNLSIGEQVKEIFTDEDAYKPLIILIVMMILVQGTGNYAITFYAVNLFVTFHPENDDHIETYLSTILIGVCRIISSLIGLYIMKHCKRRIILIGSSLSMAMFLIGSMAVEYLEPNKNVSHYASIVTTSGYMFSFGIGLMITPMVIIGELCPVRVKNITSSLSFGTSALTVFFVTKSFPYMFGHWGHLMTYFVYCISCFLLALFTFLVIPETHNVDISNLEHMYHVENTEF